MFNTIEEAIEDIKNGKMVVVIDDPDRENEGDLLMAAEMATPEAINFMAKHGRGLICMPVAKKYMDQLSIGPMVSNNTDNHETAFTVSIDHIDTTTGISAHERSLTIQKVLESEEPTDFRRPGHIFPLIAKDQGVLVRKGHTEAAVDLPRLAGLKPAGVICEIMSEDGTMARTPELIEYANKHQLKIITIADLIEYRKQTEIDNLVERVVETDMPTKYGDFRMYGFINKITGEHHVALVKGDVTTDPQLLRVHSECLTGDALGSKRCDCGEQYDEAMNRISKEESGLVLYMRQEGRGIGLINKLKAYSHQDNGLDTVEANIELGFDADLREYDVAAAMLRNLGVKDIRLMTNNPRKVDGLNKYGLNVVERVKIQMNHNERNEFYLKTKQNKLNHYLNY